MSETADWRDGLDDLDAALIDNWQSGVPVCERPFQAMGDSLGLTERAVLDRVATLRESGVFRRFGPVLNPPVIGSSMLAAISVSEAEFDAAVETINDYRQVNHNYRRDHEWNVWFVVTAGSQERRDAILDEIERDTGCAVLRLPMLTDYYIDLEFPVFNDDRFARESVPGTDASATRIAESATGDLSQLEAELLLAIQDGFPLSVTPYRDTAESIGATTDDVLAAVERLLRDNCIKRIGCVVNHVVTGFRNNCMVVWNVPDERLDEVGEQVGQLPYVTLCYHRPRRPALNWEYNLFTMVHGREADAVDRVIDELASEQLPFPHERLYSTETLKQTGARYEDLLAE